MISQNRSGSQLTEQQARQAVIQDGNTGQQVQDNLGALGVDVVLHRGAHGEVVVNCDEGASTEAVLWAGQRTGDQGNAVLVEAGVEVTGGTGEGGVIVGDGAVQRTVQQDGGVRAVVGQDLDDTVNVSGTSGGTEGNQLTQSDVLTGGVTVDGDALGVTSGVGTVGGSGMVSGIFVINNDLRNVPDTFANLSLHNMPFPSFPDQFWYANQ